MNYDWKRIETELNAKPQAEQEFVRPHVVDRKDVPLSAADYSAGLKHIECALRQAEDPA